MQLQEELPHLTKRNGYYYLMCAEGGTGYNHCVTMGRETAIQKMQWTEDGWLRLYVQDRKSWFEWSKDGTDYQKIGPVFDTSLLSDEHCKYGEFTGTMVGLTCADRVRHRHYADFDFFEYLAT